MYNDLDNTSLEKENESSGNEAEAIKEETADDTAEVFSDTSAQGSAEVKAENETISNERKFSGEAYGSTAYSYAPPVSAPEKAKKKNGALRIVALALCFSILGGALGAGGVILLSRLVPSINILGGGVSIVYQGNRPNTVLDVKDIDTDKLMTAAEIYAANVNSTVGITTSITTNFFGYQTTSAASGSGFILTSDGYIVTNHHVIEGANSVKVTDYSGKAYNALVVGYDVSNDLAVLKIEAQGLSPVVIGDSDNMNVGDSVVAIGNPLGELTFSLTAGTVSALNRSVTLSSGVTMELIQTDCAINSGNSGGALFNMYGEVIGITNAKYSSSSSSSASIDNIGFAIPLNNVRSIIEGIVEKGYLAKPYIGVQISDVNEQAQAFGLPAGAAIVTVTEGGPADKAGLKPNDIVTEVNGEKISTSAELKEKVTKSKPDDVMKLTVYRKGETLTIEVTIGEDRQSVTASTDQSQGSQSQGNQGGSVIRPW